MRRRLRSDDVLIEAVRLLELFRETLNDLHHALDGTEKRSEVMTKRIGQINRCIEELKRAKKEGIR